MVTFWSNEPGAHLRLVCWNRTIFYPWRQRHKSGNHWCVLFKLIPQGFLPRIHLSKITQSKCQSLHCLRERRKPRRRKKDKRKKERKTKEREKKERKKREKREKKEREKREKGIREKKKERRGISAQDFGIQLLVFRSFCSTFPILYHQGNLTDPLRSPGS